MSTGIEVRHYSSADAFAQDAGNIASHGWRVVAQATHKPLSGAARTWAALGVGFLIFVSLLISAGIGILGAIVCFVIAGVGRQTEFVVTYQHGQ